MANPRVVRSNGVRNTYDRDGNLVRSQRMVDARGAAAKAADITGAHYGADGRLIGGQRTLRDEGGKVIGRSQIDTGGGSWPFRTSPSRVSPAVAQPAPSVEPHVPSGGMSEGGEPVEVGNGTSEGGMPVMVGQRPQQQQAPSFRAMMPKTVSNVAGMSPAQRVASAQRIASKFSSPGAYGRNVQNAARTAYGLRDPENMPIGTINGKPVAQVLEPKAAPGTINGVPAQTMLSKMRADAERRVAATPAPAQPTQPVAQMPEQSDTEPEAKPKRRRA